MDAGVISTRYAHAIYDYAVEKNDETKLYHSMATLAASFVEFPSMIKVMTNPTVSLEKKIELLVTAGGNQSDDTTKKVIRMVVMNGRANYMRNIALVYQEYYRKKKGTVIASLTTVTLATEEMKEHLKKVIAKATGEKVEFHAKTDKDIIGGFVLQIEDMRLDASVKDQLAKMKLDMINS